MTGVWVVWDLFERLFGVRDGCLRVLLHQRVEGRVVVDSGIQSRVFGFGKRRLESGGRFGAVLVEHQGTTLVVGRNRSLLFVA